MSSTTAASTAAPSTTKTAAPSTTKTVAGMRKNGKNWHAAKTPFRPTKGQTSYEKRLEERKSIAAMKEREKEMKDEKEATRQRHIQNIKDRREAKAEKERYAKMAEKMHQKRVDRLRRREKRNKLLKS